MVLVLGLSILLRLATLAWSIRLLHKIRDWRIAFLILMVSLMTLRQFLTLLERRGPDWRSLASAETELPGLAVSVMVFLVVVFLSGLIQQQRRTQEELAAYHSLVTHDVTNFTATLKVIIERLAGEEGGARSQGASDLLKRAERQLFELERLAGNAKALVRLRDRKLPAVGTAFPLAPLVQRLLETLRQVHFDRTIEAIVRIPEGLSVAGLPLLENLFLNILDNAVRHTSRDLPVRILVEARNDAGRVAVRVRGGRPLDAEMLAGVFDRHRPGPHSSGSGLALAVVRELVGHAGGSVTAATVEEGGESAFELSLQLPGEGS